MSACDDSHYNHKGLLERYLAKLTIWEGERIMEAETADTDRIKNKWKQLLLVPVYDSQSSSSIVL